VAVRGRRRGARTRLRRGSRRRAGGFRTPWSYGSPRRGGTTAGDRLPNSLSSGVVHHTPVDEQEVIGFNGDDRCWRMAVRLGGGKDHGRQVPRGGVSCSCSVDGPRGIGVPESSRHAATPKNGSTILSRVHSGCPDRSPVGRRLASSSLAPGTGTGAIKGVKTLGIVVSRLIMQCGPWRPRAGVF
jgi:hypothetical protein